MNKDKMNSVRYKFTDYTIIQTSDVLNSVTAGQWQSKYIFLMHSLGFLLIFRSNFKLTATE